MIGYKRGEAKALGDEMARRVKSAPFVCVLLNAMCVCADLRLMMMT